MLSKMNEYDVKINSKVLRKGDFLLIPGPCAIEADYQAFEIAELIKNNNISFYRGGIYKPRTSPYTFQGIGDKGLDVLRHIRSKYGLIICSEIMDVRQIDKCADSIDIIQVGARNMQNYSLLKELGKIKKAILLKRGFCSTVDEWILSSEYIRSGGNENIIFCERGIRTFENSTRNTLDLSSVIVLKERTSLPVIVDPSHASGNRKYVIALSKAAISVGADGLLIDVYKNPDSALVDGKQSLDFDLFKNMLFEISKMLVLMNKKIV